MIIPCNLCLSQRILIQILNNFNVWILIWTSGTYICSELNLGSFEKIMIQNLPYIFHIVVSNGLPNVDKMKDFWNIQGVLPLSRFWKGVVICRTEMIMYKYKMSMFWLLSSMPWLDPPHKTIIKTWTCITFYFLPTHVWWDHKAVRYFDNPLPLEMPRSNGLFPWMDTWANSRKSQWRWRKLQNKNIS